MATTRFNTLAIKISLKWGTGDIQVLLGHKKLETTALYAQVATALLHEVLSPLDSLKTMT